MRLLRLFSCPAAFLAICWSGALGADGLYQPSMFAAPEPEVAACGYVTSDGYQSGAYYAPHGGYSSRSGWSLFPSFFACNGHGDPWTLQNYLTGPSSSISYGGWLSVGAYANAHGAPDNGPIGMRDVGDEFTVNQLWGYFEKAANTGGSGWDWGFRADFVWGVDGPDTQAFGSSPDAWDNPWDSSTNYGSALPQLYAELAVDDLKVKVGHFYTIHGYEVVAAPSNFFTSHSYTFYFGEPFTHTGVIAEYSPYDNVTLWGGWVQGWDTAFDDPLDSSDFLGGFKVPLTGSIMLSYVLDIGDSAVDNDRYLQSIVADFSLTERLNYVLQSDWGSFSNGVNGQWYGVNNYLFYSLNDCWKLGSRLEWFRDDDGLRIPGGGSGDYWGLTCGVNWIPTANLIVRPELRYDWANGGPAPFDGGTESDQFSGGFDLIVTF